MGNELMQRPMSQLGEYQESKQLSEIKGKMYLARQFPRDINRSLNAALEECGQLRLAEQAQYEFPRGESTVKGPSIRLVEVLARHWGNLDFGVNEIETDGDSTTIKCFAWDLETNVYDEKTFSVPHVRSTKKGSYKLTDERDIYEAVANKGARRKRACLLSVLPGWYVDAAIEACEKTLEENINKTGKSLPEIIESMVNAFAGYGVTREQLSAKMGRDVDKISARDVVRLRNLYSSIKDGFVKPTDVFGGVDIPPAELPSEKEAETLESLNAELTGGLRDGTEQR